MGDSASNVASTSSSQIQSAIDQLTYLQRLLNGDDEMSLSDLLASTSASGPSSSLPPGGLSKALPALLSPLLPLKKVQNSSFGFNNGAISQAQEAMLAKRAAFQPRSYLAMTSELTNRLSDTSSEMHQAIKLAQNTLSKIDPETTKQRRNERILNDRKRRKLMASQQAAQADDNANLSQQQDTSDTFGSLPVFYFPSALIGQAKAQEPKLSTKPSRSVLEQFIQAWQSELQGIDGDLSMHTRVSILQWTSGGHRERALLNIKIDQMGVVWLWVDFTRKSGDAEDEDWIASITQINILAESEVEELDRNYLLSLALQTSRFPLYRRLTLLLHTKLMELKKQESNPWSNLIVALFALASLYRLHDLQTQTGFTLNNFASLRGQDSILNALMYLEPAPMEEEISTAVSMTDGEAIPVTVPDLERPQIPSKDEVDKTETDGISPQSALFSDSQPADVSS